MPPNLRPVPPPAPHGPRAAPSGVILADAVYPLSDFLRAVGWKKGALSTAKADGLIVRRAGGRAYVIGSDWLDYLRRGSSAQEDA